MELDGPLCQPEDAVLRCVECGVTVDEHSPNWRAYIAGPDQDDNGEFVVVYWPDCARREFGPFEREDRLRP